MREETDKTKLFTRGGQIIFNNVRMGAQIGLKIILWGLWLIIATLSVTLVITTSWETLSAVYYYGLAWFFLKLGLTQYVFHVPWHDETLSITTRGILTQSYFKHQFALLLHQIAVGLSIGLGGALILGTGLTVWLIKRGKQQAEKRFVRGAKIETPQKVTQIIKKLGASDIAIASVPMVKDFEVKHTLIHGTTGTGKSQLFNQLIEQIRRRGDSAIIFDKGCVFTGLFYRPERDILLNPFDARSENWDLWAESKSEPDFENIAESLIPSPPGGTDPYWTNTARSVFSAAAYRMSGEPCPSLNQLLALLLTASLDELGAYLKGTQAAPPVSGKIDKTVLTIRSVISTYLKSLRFLTGLKGEPFSIRHWIQTVADTKKSHFLFISSNAEHHATIRPLISLWLSIASNTLLSLEENYNRRIWFICDELPTLNQLPQLGSTIAEVRKFGGCYVLGMQSFSQLQKIYGQATALEIFDLLNTRLFFRSPSADMAALISKELGQEEIEKSNESYSYGANTIRDGISINTQHITRPLVSPAEIMELPNLSAFLRVPEAVPITKINIDYQERPKINSGFILRKQPVSSVNPEVKPKQGDPFKNENSANSQEEKAMDYQENDHSKDLGKSSKNHTVKDHEIANPSKQLQLQEENILIDKEKE